MPFVQSYTNIFGGNKISVVYPSYLAYNLTANITLNWASSFVDNSNVVASIMDFTQNAGGYVVTLPDATLVSQGQPIIINNTGAHSFTINDNAGNLLFSPAIGTSWQLYLRDNSTQGGTWGFVQNGSLTSNVAAASLVSNPSGLIASGGFLNTNLPNQTVNANYTLLASDRANVFIWTGGVGTLTLPTLASVGNGYFVAFNNQGGGTLTINQGADGATIDGSTSIALKPGQSCFIDAQTPANLAWNTIGLGINSTFAFTATSVNVAGNVNINLTNQQAANQIIKLTGLLTGNITVTWPTVTGVWYVYNNTTGLFTIQANGGLNIPQNEKVILYCDGTNFYITPTVATSVVFNDGSAANPSIAFASDPTSGLYKVGAGAMGYSSVGANKLTLGSISGGKTGLSISNGSVLQLIGSSGGNYATLKAGAMLASVDWTWPITDAVSANGILQSNAAGVLSFSTATYPATTTINQLLYSSAANVISGLATANNATLITSAGGVPSISQTLPAAVQGNITTLGTITSGVWNGTPIIVQYGGTGLATLTTAYGVVCAGTTATGALQNAGTGTANQILVSNGNAALPTWQTITTNVLPAAVKADQTTATSTTKYVNPGVQQYHPSAQKAYITFYFDGVNTITRNSYNATVARVTTGIYTITFPTPFTTANYTFTQGCQFDADGINGGTYAAMSSAAAGGVDPTPSTCRIIIFGIIGGVLTSKDNGAGVSLMFSGTQ